MSEIKNILISIIIFIIWSAGLFVAGYLLSNRNATERINKANQQLTEQQQKYEIIISSTTAKLRDIGKELSGAVADNEQATTELSEIIEQIRKQKLNLQV